MVVDEHQISQLLLLTPVPTFGVYVRISCPECALRGRVGSYLQDWMGIVLYFDLLRRGNHLLSIKYIGLK